MWRGRGLLGFGTCFTHHLFLSARRPWPCRLFSCEQWASIFCRVLRAILQTPWLRPRPVALVLVPVVLEAQGASLSAHLLAPVTSVLLQVLLLRALRPHSGQLPSRQRRLRLQKLSVSQLLQKLSVPQLLQMLRVSQLLQKLRVSQLLQKLRMSQLLQKLRVLLPLQRPLQRLLKRQLRCVCASA